MHILSAIATVLVQGCYPYALTLQIYSDTGFLWTRMQTMPTMMMDFQNRLERWIMK